MSKQKEYIKLKLTNDGYDIYVITEKNRVKLGHKNTLIMSKVIKKYPCQQINNSTYIYSDIVPIMFSFYKEKIKSKNRKVNRKKSRNIMTSIMLTAALTIGGGALATHLANVSNDASNSSVGTESEFEEEEMPVIVSDVNITNLLYTDNTNKFIMTVEDNSEENKTIANETDITIQEEAKNQEEILEEVNDANIMYFCYEYEDIGDKEALENASQYMDIFQKYEKIYGVDANLLCAIAAQESSGIHREYSVNGYATGLMGIENIWAGESLTVFNFETNQEETITIDYSNIGNIDYNIKIGSAIFQNYFNHTLRNNSDNITESELLALAIQKYNMGPGNISKILKLGNNWMDNREMIDAGDQNYFEHVLSRLDNDTVIKIKQTDGSYYTTNINNQALTIQHTKM